MKKTTKLKVYAFFLAMALVVLSPTTMNAQNDNYFRTSDDFSGNRFASDWAIMNLGIGQDAPLGGGLLVLGVAGAGYAVARRRRSLKKGAAMLAALAVMLGFTQCKKNLETIATAPANGVYITLDVDGGSKVDVNPNANLPYATVTFEKDDIIYVGNNGKYCGYLKHNGDKFTGTITPTSGDDADYLHFYFMGNKGGESEPTSVSITDQKDKYPVISYGRSTSLYQKNTTSYTATLHNYCSIMKFPIAGDGTDKQVTLKGMCNKVTVNFAANNANNGAASVNPYTYSKEDSGDIVLHSENDNDKWAIVLPQDGVEAKLYADGYKTAFVSITAIETNKYYNNNITAIALETGTADDLFSVGADTKVRFSSGNLQATGTTSSTPSGGWTWSFAPDQWSYIGNNTANTKIKGSGELDADGTVDLFGWSTASTYYGINDSDSPADYSGAFKDWGKVANAANLGGHNDWRTLTKDEWVYVFNTRNTTSGIRYAKAQVNGVNGVILLPDNWSVGTYSLNNPNSDIANYSGNQISQSEWTDKLEANGAIFLPAAGYRRLKAKVSYVGSDGAYWSATYYNNDSGDYAYDVCFYDSHLNAEDWHSRRSGRSVRLVR